MHHGATSQDIVDTAAMLVARRARALVVEELDAVARACAALAREHAGTAMAGRTLLQQALPVTFGLRPPAGSTRRSTRAPDCCGRGSTRSSAAPPGRSPRSATPAPRSRRTSPGGSGSARRRCRGTRRAGASRSSAPRSAVAAGTMGKLGLDLVLLAQTEVAEVVAGAGASSAMPHKRNPVGAVRARACALRVPPLAALLLGAMAQEHERAAGAGTPSGSRWARCSR